MFSNIYQIGEYELITYAHILINQFEHNIYHNANTYDFMDMPQETIAVCIT